MHSAVKFIYISTGRGKVAFADPPSGSLIADFQDTANASTLTCNITDEQGQQLGTDWTLQNFRGYSSQLQSITAAGVRELFAVSGDPTNYPGITYRNRLLILNLTSELDDVMVYCGARSHLRDANFTLRIYRKQLLVLAIIVNLE